MGVTVNTDVVVDVKDSKAKVAGLSDKVLELGQRIRGTSSLTGGLVGQMLALGGAYLGLSTLGNAFVGMTKSASDFNSELEKTKISIATVLSAVQGTTYESAAKTADKVFKQLRDDAIASVATSKELFSVFQAIVGPISSAGFGLDKVRTLTNDAVSASSVLGIDFQQASRDMQMMVRGAAGVDVKLFSMLKSVGAITESTEQWNKKLTQAQRIEKLGTALAQFAPAASRFQHSWAGLTSTFQDLTESLRSSIFSPVFEVLKRSLDKLNESILGNRTKLEAHLRSIGESMAGRLETVFLRAENGMRWVINHWDEIIGKINTVVARVKEIAPMIAKAALANQALNIGRAVVGNGMVAGGYLASAAGALGGLTRGVGRAAGTGVGDVGGATGLAAMASGAVGEAPAAAAMAAFGSGVAGLGAVLVTVGGAILVVQEQWDNLSKIFEASTDGMVGEVVGLGKAVWETLAPVFKMFAQGPLLLLVTGFTVLAPVVKAMVVALRMIFETLGSITTAIYDSMKPGFDWLWGALANFAEKLKAILGPAFDMLGIKGAASGQRGLPAQYDMRKDEHGMFDATKPTGFQMFNPDDYNDTPKKRVTIHNDFRGSSITVKQDFREADPDNVFVKMVRELNQAAALRTRSGFSPDGVG